MPRTSISWPNFLARLRDADPQSFSASSHPHGAKGTGAWPCRAPPTPPPPPPPPLFPPPLRQLPDRRLRALWRHLRCQWGHPVCGCCLVGGFPHIQCLVCTVLVHRIDEQVHTDTNQRELVKFSKKNEHLACQREGWFLAVVENTEVHPLWVFFVVFQPISGLFVERLSSPTVMFICNFPMVVL